MTKKYRLILLDFNKTQGNRLILDRVCYSLRQARKFAPMKISYSKNAKCFTGWSDNVNCIVKEI